MWQCDNWVIGEGFYELIGYCVNWNYISGWL